MSTNTATIDKPANAFNVDKPTTALTSNVGRELQFGSYDREQVELLKRTVAKGATDDQFALFMTIAQRRRLDPFARQIWCVLRKNKDGVVEMAVQTAIDGFRLIAQRTGEYDGQEKPLWCGADGVWKDVWLDSKPPEAALVLVYRKGVSRPSPGIAHLKSYAAYKADGKSLEVKWAQMPEHMLAKCAEALALRKAFPEELSGVYTDDEMDHANAIDVQSVEKLPALPAASAEPQVDPWVTFLAELAPVAAPFAAAFKKSVDLWDEDDIKTAWTELLTGETVGAVNDAVGPWMVVINRYNKLSTRAATLKADLEVPYKARTAKLRADVLASAKSSVPAQEGPQP